MSGTAVTSTLGEIRFQVEASFAANTTTVTGAPVQVRDVKVPLEAFQRKLIDPGGTFTYVGSMDAPRLGPLDTVEFEFTLDLHGNGAATTGALTGNQLTALLGHALGNLDSTQVGGTASAGGSTVSLPTANATIVGGGLVRVGALNDGRGGGQYVAVDPDDSASAWDLLTAMAVAADAGDVIYASHLAYPVTAAGSLDLTSSSATTNNTLRFWIATGNLQWIAHGCACTGIAIKGLSPGELPQITLKWAAVAWQPVSNTFPSGTAPSVYAPAVGANGSLFLNTVGTTARVTDVPASFEMEIDQKMIPVKGQGGVHSGQTVVGWRRAGTTAKYTITLEAEAVTASPTYQAYYNTNPNSAARSRLLYTHNPVDGASIGIYSDDVIPCGQVPSQTEVGGLNYVKMEWYARRNTRQTATSDISLAPFIIAQG